MVLVSRSVDSDGQLDRTLLSLCLSIRYQLHLIREKDDYNEQGKH